MEVEMMEVDSVDQRGDADSMDLRGDADSVDLRGDADSVDLQGHAASVDLRESLLLSPVKDQGSGRSCTAFACCLTVEHMFKKLIAAKYSLDNKKKKDYSLEISVQDVYENTIFNERMDKIGHQLITPFRYMIYHGCTLESSNPYRQTWRNNQFRLKRQVVFTLDDYDIIPLRDMKDYLRDTGPIVVGIPWIDSQMSAIRDEIYEGPKDVTDFIEKPGNTVSGHSFTVIGYGSGKVSDRTVEFWLVQNSHGEEWGNKGYGRFSTNIKLPNGEFLIDGGLVPKIFVGGGKRKRLLHHPPEKDGGGKRRETTGEDSESKPEEKNRKDVNSSAGFLLKSTQEPGSSSRMQCQSKTSHPYPFIIPKPDPVDDGEPDYVVPISMILPVNLLFWSRVLSGSYDYIVRMYDYITAMIIFFRTEMHRDLVTHGGIYVSGNTIDGCVTFSPQDRFSHVKKYEVEFNKAVQSLTDAMIPTTQKKTALNRLVKDNVALIVVLETKVNNQPVDNLRKRQLLCVANTHVHVQQDLEDVKLWQVHTLLKGLEKIATGADIPMLVCGDFNSVPGSAPHSLLAMGKVDPSYPDLTVDQLNILRPHSKLVHQLPLVSAYSSFARTAGLPFEQHKRRLDGGTNEPLCTSVTRDFVGTLDYIFYTADSLVVDSLLELLDEESLRKGTAFPSPGCSSDHIALLAGFRCCKSKSRH